MDTLLNQILNHVLGLNFEHLSKTHINHLEERLVDIIGCTVGGARAHGNNVLLEVFRQAGGKEEATVLFYGDRLPVDQVAMMNALQCRSYDFEVSEIDAYQSENRTTGHICATVDTVALTLGEMLHAHGQDVILAAAVGADLAVRLASAEHFHPDKSFDLTGTVTAFGAAAAAARLYRLNKVELRHALGILTNLVSGSFQSVHDGALSFKLAQGAAARNALLAVNLARGGFTGMSDPFFSPRGYFAQFTKESDCRYITNGLGSRLFTRGYHKAYPGCFEVHAAVDGCMELIGPGDISSTDIHQVVVEVWPHVASSFIGQEFLEGDSAEKALFNLRYAVANTLARGDSLPSHYDPCSIRDPEVLRLAGIVQIDPVLPVEWGHGVAAIVHILLKDGAKRSSKIPVAPGFPARPRSSEEIDSKFLANVKQATGISESQSRKALEMLRSMRDLQDVALLAPLLTSRERETQ